MFEEESRQSNRGGHFRSFLVSLTTSLIVGSTSANAVHVEPIKVDILPASKTSTEPSVELAPVASARSFGAQSHRGGTDIGGTLGQPRKSVQVCGVPRSTCWPPHVAAQFLNFQTVLDHNRDELLAQQLEILIEGLRAFNAQEFGLIGTSAKNVYAVFRPIANDLQHRSQLRKESGRAINQLSSDVLFLRDLLNVGYRQIELAIDQSNSHRGLPAQPASLDQRIRCSEAREAQLSASIFGGIVRSSYVEQAELGGRRIPMGTGVLIPLQLVLYALEGLNQSLKASLLQSSLESDKVGWITFVERELQLRFQMIQSIQDSPSMSDHAKKVEIDRIFEGSIETAQSYLFEIKQSAEAICSNQRKGNQ